MRGTTSTRNSPISPTTRRWSRPSRSGRCWAQDASLRALTYATADLTIEIEITADAVLGQILPPQAGSASTYLAAGPVAETSVDDMGFFAIRPVPTSSFRLRCVTASGLDIMTGLITP
ncbi:MAG TPA: hypothetical protein VGQ92_20910 [Actinoplanes sp.]|nr:hypothetical protein [Actinoplanes sp.]